MSNSQNKGYGTNVVQINSVFLSKCKIMKDNKKYVVIIYFSDFSGWYGTLLCSKNKRQHCASEIGGNQVSIKLNIFI